MTRNVNESASNARLEVYSGPLAGKVFQLEGELEIGRQDENSTPSGNQDIYLPDSRVSRRHARLFIKKGNYFLEDLNSTNGTFLNAHNIAQQEPVMMRKGTSVQVGQTLLKFYPASRPEVLSEDKRASSPWESEIGLNEQVLDLVKPNNLSDDM